MFLRPEPTAEDDCRPGFLILMTGSAIASCSRRVIVTRVVADTRYPANTVWAPWRRRPA